MYCISVLICAISSSHGVKLNVHGEMRVGSNAAGLLGKMLEIYGEDNTHQQNNDGIRNKPLQTSDDESKGENGKRSDYRFPWDTWYSWYDEYKNHKHGSGHKHHKKYNHHDLEYYYSSYEDDYNKHIIIPWDNGKKRHIVIPKNSGEGVKKHIVIPKDSGEGVKKHIVIPKNGDANEIRIFPSLGKLASIIWGKQNEKIQSPYDNREDDDNGSREGKSWRPPQYGSGETNKGYDQGYGNKEHKPSARGFLRQLWDVYKTFREKE